MKRTIALLLTIILLSACGRQTPTVTPQQPLTATAELAPTVASAATLMPMVQPTEATAESTATVTVAAPESNLAPT
ncbi:MAG: hypothetical protein GXY68_07530, partial [Chloroflexi bacterium]|nr:hypothetical protein [Chloroflexota bacterium]